MYQKPTDVQELLIGHTSPETAVTTDSYPYGSLRANARWWMETKKGFGMRTVFQTQNPKNSVWNKPKPGTYSMLEILYRDSKGHVQTFGANGYTFSNEAELNQFELDFAPALQSDELKDRVKLLRALIRANGKLVYTIKDRQPGDTTPVQTLEEQRKIVVGAVGHEYSKL